MGSRLQHFLGSHGIERRFVFQGHGFPALVVRGGGGGGGIQLPFYHGEGIKKNVPAL
jgi:hypothetical protein